MQKIIIEFKTNRGVEAYKKVTAEGDSKPFVERRISKSVAVDKIVSKDPFIVEIKIKLKKLAVALQLDKQVKESLKKFGAINKKDYVMRLVHGTSGGC